MAWQEPGSNQNKSKSNSSPPDLEALLKDFFGKLSGGGSGSSGSGNGGFKPSILFFSLFILLAVWVVSGFVVIKEAERGVLLRFGRYTEILSPGLNWKMTFIDKVYQVDIKTVRSLSTSGVMLTKDENIVHVEMNVQYRISDPYRYLFSVVNPDNSISQAVDSSLRYVVGHSNMDDVLTTGRELVRQQTRDSLESIIGPYEMGIDLVDINFLPARPPEAVKDAFDDAIAAQEDEQRFIREAEAYERDKLPEARGRVERLLQEARAYKQSIISSAKGEVVRFEKLLPAYRGAPEIVKKRIYLQTLSEIYRNNKKVYIDLPEGSNSMIYLPLDKILAEQNQVQTQIDKVVEHTNSIVQPTKSVPVVSTNGSRNSERLSRSDAIKRALERSRGGNGGE